VQGELLPDREQELALQPAFALEVLRAPDLEGELHAVPQVLELDLGGRVVQHVGMLGCGFQEQAPNQLGVRIPRDPHAHQEGRQLAGMTPVRDPLRDEL
jgi:hypothetical protein